MSPAAAEPTAAKPVLGGSFLLGATSPDAIFTLEDLSDEQRQIAQATTDFAENEILPNVAAIERKEFSVTRSLLAKAGELGLLGTDIPEQYGGLEMDKIASGLIAENIGICGSFAVAFGAHVGIGTLPLAWYGTTQQKEKYLPKLGTGEWIAAYALSEASSGSDAMNIKTDARLSEDGTHYVLNGEKMWISNAGIANLFTVFAKIDRDKFSAFLIERDAPGLTIGHEERKLGIRGSSTCALVLAECKVPVENLLGEIGKGHHIAFNILNVGRYKLGCSALGGAKYAFRNGVRYARERVAFAKPISSFGLVQEKIARSAAGLYAGEALVYRTIGAIDAALHQLDRSAPDFTRSVQSAIEEFAVECSIVKVWTSEMLDRLVDDMLQIHGGYGYVEEFPAERAYRDSRINRIFEGTNEINRLIITGWTIKRALAGRLALMPAIQRVMDEVMAGPQPKADGDGPLAHEHALLSNGRKLALFAAGAAAQRYGMQLSEEQEVMGALADLIQEVYVFESAMLRAEKLASRKTREADMAIKLTRYYAAHSFRILESAAEKVIATVAEGDTLRTQMTIVRRLTKHEPSNTVALGREIAQAITEAGRYTL